ncbi:MAG: HAD family hydrolase [Verrucomicrobia bacterium]|nr:MAG: HAD family hydrolase [Verrucomicrobiota bacterium]
MTAKSQSSDLGISSGRWAAIRLFAMDVDGVLTDGTIRISSDGVESKVFSVLDGLGLVRLRQAGIVLAWISGRKSGATSHRATELKIPHLVQGRIDKCEALEELASHLSIHQEDICYMGDDDIDAAAIRWAGIGISVPAGVPAALEAADIVTTRPAGYGAVREICDRILAGRESGGHS